MFNENGVINGVYYCNEKRSKELSERAFARNLSSRPLQPQFSLRPVSTKYTLMPIVDQRKEATVPLHSYETYNVRDTFNPGDAQGPWSGFASNVNDESKLRNQFFALQECEQPNYVPSSDSDLYKVTIDSKPIKQNHPLLFEKFEFEPEDKNPYNLGKKVFYNATRQEIKEVTPRNK